MTKNIAKKKPQKLCFELFDWMNSKVVYSKILADCHGYYIDSHIFKGKRLQLVPESILKTRFKKEDLQELFQELEVRVKRIKNQNQDY